MTLDATPTDRPPPLWLLRALLLAAVGVAYHNSFGGAFVFDDLPAIIDNAGLRDLPGVLRALPRLMRPVTELTLALNFAVTGTGVAGFHAFNVATHAAAALVLFELARATLASPNVRVRPPAEAVWVAFAVALLWAVHPLQTQSVTYVIQRAQALAGLFELLTLYALARGAAAPRRGWAWSGLAVLASALAMGSKQDAVVTPVLALLYDRAFLSASWRGVARRGAVHVPLFATWAVLGLSAQFAVQGSADEATATAGFASGRTTWWTYALTESEVVLHYLRLAAWPRPLCLDYYDWPLATGLGDVAPAVAAVFGLLAATGVLLWRRPPLGFLAAAFFVALAPTTTVMPIDDVVNEHRMYSALVGPVALAVLGVAAALRRLDDSARPWVGLALLSGVAVTFVALTVERNEAYHTPEALWHSVTAARPGNGRSRHDLGVYLARAGRPAEAIPHFQKASELKPSKVTSAQLAKALMECNRHAEALPHYRAALTHLGRPSDRAHLEGGVSDQTLHYNLGKLSIEHGNDPEQALRDCREAARRFPDAVEMHLNLSRPLIELGRWPEAADALGDAVRVAPDSGLARNNLGLVLIRLGRFDQALTEFDAATRLDPNSAGASHGRGVTLLRLGRTADAVAAFRQGLACQPPDPRLRYSLAHALHQTGSAPEATSQYREGLREAPRWPAVAAASAWGLATNPKPELRDPWEAVRLAEQATQATGEAQADPLDALGAAYAASGRYDAAVVAATKAERLYAQAAPPRAAAIRARVALYREQRAFVAAGR